MTKNLPTAYCFFQDLTPRPPMDVVFDRDYLLYAISGALKVTVGGGNWLLPPSFAAWIPANTQFQVEIDKPLTSCSVLVQPKFCKTLPERPVVFQMSTLARHMIRHCKHWSGDSVHPAEAEGFFLSLLNVCAELAVKSIDVKRPHAADPIVQKAMFTTAGHLSEKVTAAEVARAVNMSERSMQRRFAADVGMTWSQVLTRLRMIRALELLSQEEFTIIQVAGDCGFNSLSAFNRAFLQFAAKTPSEFRHDLRD